MEDSKMSACTSHSPHDLSRVQQISRSGEKRVRVCVAAHNRLLREALVRILTKRGNVEVTGVDSPLACEAETLLRQGAEVLLLVSQGIVQEDLAAIQRVRAGAPGVRILLIGSTNEDGEF